MATFKDWVSAARLRTLPLSVSGIILGSFIAAANGYTNARIVILALFTTIGFQVLSNFANDYGDGVKGTDNDERIGPERALQSGAISPKQMLNAIIVTSVISAILGLALIYTAFGRENFLFTLIFIVLIIASIVAAMKYTMGKNAYGYSGLGDVFVFIFFGLLSVCGTYFLFTQILDWKIFLPAISVGLLSSGVLNLNNMRDINSDRKSNKNTLVVKIGSKKAVKYHTFLILGAVICALAYSFIDFRSYKQFIYIVAFVPILMHLIKAIRTEKPEDFDPELKKLALSTFLFSILFGLGMIL
ncbi:1,4-dihydroxy-2-naphthoate polyprenyltransferase [Aureivirga sp. CE67]|uniref:1,4-dihydroxy-2-naphthoate polyprenyltransferase n=1 Tax=Aureivirga sp. CE67 TaxID=1788983 RepID=UPI0018CA82CB|nr:1,4-dihydroxy-2-naphthoate polyprenyltransferase [Aureivirga sp. CE67]